MSNSFELPPPPAQYFYNQFWRHKLIRWGWSSIEAGMIARNLATKCYLTPYNMHIQCLRDASEEYRYPDPKRAVNVILQRAKNEKAF